MAEKLGVNPGAPVFVILSIFVLIMAYLYGTLILLTTLTVLYPSLRSIRAIQTEAGDDDKTWLTYWMVFGSFTALETYVGFLMEFLPHYHLFRFLFFIWLLIPWFNGAEIMYKNVMRPLVNANKDQIQKLIKRTHDYASKAASDAAKAASDPKNLMSAVNAAAQAQSKLAEVAESAKDKSPKKELPVVANNID